MTRRHGSQRLSRIFAAPSAIALVSLVGLVSALTGDGVRDQLSWVALAIPIIAVFWAMSARRT